MGDPLPNSASQALEFAAQHSEARRLLLVAFVFGIFGSLAVLRAIAGVKSLFGDSIYAIIPCILLGVASALAARAVVMRANRHNRLLPMWFWVVNLITELLIPTIGIFILIIDPQINGFEALGAPVVLTYAVLIVLSVLRLRVWLCFLAGSAAAAMHVGLFFASIRWEEQMGALGPAFYLGYSIQLFLVGIASALVTREVCGYVRSALQEAEVKARLSRVENDLGIARHIQQGLFPKAPPTIAGYDIAGWSKPADETGGDYYDWLPFEGGKLALVLGDVTGHGIGPALLMAVCRAYARATFPTEDELQNAMNRLNKLLNQDMDEGRFITFAVGLVDPAAGTVDVLSAGHGPILLRYNTDGKVAITEADGTGLPLGIMADETYGKPVHWKLNPGDAMLLITDGFFEQVRTSDGEQFGLDRLRDFLVRSAKLSSADLIKNLYAEVVAFAGGAVQGDDMTAVVIRRL
ncbi:MAG: PP2C family protein-serine/threonine phosphatase [Phycisphaerae bacterium]|nr:PP2C family protein-serine/threonine phosphatase [Phycisphaerae bacterium]